MHPMPLTEPPPPPDSLPEAARAYWEATTRELVAMGTLLPVMLPVVAIYCRELARHDEIARLNDELLPILNFAAREGRPTRNPYERALVLCANSVRQLAAELQITPRSASRRRQPRRQAHDPWETF